MVPFALFCLAAAVFRVAAGVSDHETARQLANFSPVAALFLCGGMLAPRRAWAWILPFAAFLASDLILSWRYAAGQEDVALGSLLLSPALAVRYGFFALLFVGARFLRPAAGLPALLGTAMTASFAFYLVTNTASWLGSPGYPQSFAGWVQALTWGLPGYPPTFLFFRNTLLGDLVFTGLLAVAMGAVPFRRPAPARAVPLGEH